jgi:hypothetical protein
MAIVLLASDHGKWLNRRESDVLDAIVFRKMFWLSSQYFRTRCLAGHVVDLRKAGASSILELRRTQPESRSHPERVLDDFGKAHARPLVDLNNA